MIRYGQETMELKLFKIHLKELKVTKADFDPIETIYCNTFKIVKIAERKKLNKFFDLVEETI